MLGLNEVCDLQGMIMCSLMCIWIYLFKLFPNPDINKKFEAPYSRWELNKFSKFKEVLILCL